MSTLRQDIGIIGIGGAGTNIAYLFEKKGYNTIHINSSMQDLGAISGSKNIYHLEGFNGCAGNRELAAQALARNIDLIDRIKAMEEGNLLLCFASGGGTGSGVGPALAGILADETEKTVCCMVVLPAKDEEYGNHVNALRCCMELMETPGVGAVMYLDNSSGSKKEINYQAVHQFDLFVSDASISERGNVDEEERRLMLSAHGSLVLSILGRDRATVDGMTESLTTKKIYAPLQNDGVCDYIAIINSCSSNIRKEDVTRIVGTPRRTFLGYDGKQCIIALSGLSAPIDHLNSLRELAKRYSAERKERQANARKARLADLDFDEEDAAMESKNAKSEKPEKEKKLSRREMLMKMAKG